MTWTPTSVWIAGLSGVALISSVDYVSGAELRVFPLYFLPVSFVAWHRGRAGALLVALVCAVSWTTSNYLAGLRFSHDWLWIGNSFMQGMSFATVGMLIASLRSALLRERALSRTDPLTSLLNSRAFEQEAARLVALCRRRMHPLTIAYIDLDNFKVVNDQRGHAAGDDLLRQVATLLQASIRPSDLLARLGGDEFAILFPELNEQDAAAALERLRFVLHRNLQSGGSGVTASIGGLTYVVPPDHVDVMLREADRRMFTAKARGRNRVHLEVSA